MFTTVSLDDFSSIVFVVGVDDIPDVGGGIDDVGNVGAK